jgi:hypothetical protein
MTLNYAEIREAANDAINEAGQSGYLRRTTAGTGTDPWNTGAGTVTDYPVRFVLVDYAERDRDGTLVQVNDQQAIIAVGSLAKTTLGSMRHVEHTAQIVGMNTLTAFATPGVNACLVRCQPLPLLRLPITARTSRVVRFAVPVGTNGLPSLRSGRFTSIAPSASACGAYSRMRLSRTRRGDATAVSSYFGSSRVA